LSTGILKRFRLVLANSAQVPNLALVERGDMVTMLTGGTKAPRRKQEPMRKLATTKCPRS